MVSDCQSFIYTNTVLLGIAITEVNSLGILGKNKLENPNIFNFTSLPYESYIVMDTKSAFLLQLYQDIL